MGKEDRDAAEAEDLQKLLSNFSKHNSEIRTDLEEISHFIQEIEQKKQRGQKVRLDLVSLMGLIKKLDRHDHLFKEDIIVAEHTVSEEIKEARHEEQTPISLHEMTALYNQIRDGWLNGIGYTEQQVRERFHSKIERIGVENISELQQRPSKTPKLTLNVDGHLMGVQLSSSEYVVFPYYKTRVLSGIVFTNGVSHAVPEKGVFILKGKLKMKLGSVGQNFTALKPAILKWGVHPDFDEELLIIEEQGELLLS